MVAITFQNPNGSAGSQTEVSATAPLPVTQKISGADVSTSNPLPVSPGYGATVTTTITRPADTTAYAINDAWADSTSAPTAGGFTFTGPARASGGSGVIADLIVVSTNDPATLLQGEVWIFDSSVTAINDNAAFTVSDGDAVKLVGVVPFVLASTMNGSGNNSYANVQNLALGFTCSGSADLRYLVKVKNAYTPASGEQLTVRLKIVQTN